MHPYLTLSSSWIAKLKAVLICLRGWTICSDTILRSWSRTCIWVLNQGPCVRNLPITISRHLWVKNNSHRRRGRICKWCKAIHWTPLLCGWWIIVILFWGWGHWYTAQNSENAGTVYHSLIAFQDEYLATDLQVLSLGRVHNQCSIV